MKVIFLKDVSKVGRKYDVKEVSSGYALNFLIPKGLVKVATAEGIAKVDVLKKGLEADRKVQENLIEKDLKSLEGKEIELKQKVNEKGHLFGSIHKDQLATLISSSLGISIDESFIVLDKPIKEAGSHEVEISVNGKSATLKLNIIAE